MDLQIRLKKRFGPSSRKFTYHWSWHCNECLNGLGSKEDSCQLPENCWRSLAIAAKIIEKLMLWHEVEKGEQLSKNIGKHLTMRWPDSVKSPMLLQCTLGAFLCFDASACFGIAIPSLLIWQQCLSPLWISFTVLLRYGVKKRWWSASIALQVICCCEGGVFGLFIPTSVTKLLS